MKASWQIGQIAGISIRLHATFPLLLAWIAITKYRERGSWDSAAAEVAFIAILFFIIVLHELGHALTAKRFGITTRDITLLPIGGVARLDRMPRDPRQEFLVAVAGPAVNVALAALLFGVLYFLYGSAGLLDVQLIQGNFLARLAWINVTLALFNLVPAFPMDGGRVLRAILAMRLDYVRATNIAATIGQGLALVAGLIGLSGNPFLVFIAVFIWIGAAEEASATRFRSALAGLPVERVMMTEFHTLHAGDPLTRAIDHAVASGQHDFPVVEHGQVVGVLRHSDLLDTLAKSGAASTVGDAMHRKFRTVEAEEKVEGVFERLLEDECRTLPVLRHNRLVGLLTFQSLGEYVTLKTKLDQLTSARAAEGERQQPPRLSEGASHERV